MAIFKTISTLPNHLQRGWGKSRRNGTSHVIAGLTRNPKWLGDAGIRRHDDALAGHCAMKQYVYI